MAIYTLFILSFMKYKVIIVILANIKAILAHYLVYFKVAICKRMQLIKTKQPEKSVVHRSSWLPVNKSKKTNRILRKLKKISITDTL